MSSSDSYAMIGSAKEDVPVAVDLEIFLKKSVLGKSNSAFGTGIITSGS